MPSNSNDWNRTRRGSSENWDDDYDRSDYNRNRNYGNDYDENNYGNSGNYGYGQRRGNYGSSPGEEYNDRNLSNNDYSRNRGMYRSSMGMNREGGGYSNMGDDRNRGSRGYQGSGYGSGYDRNRDYNNRDWWDKTKDEVSSWFGDDDAQRRRRMDETNEGRYRGKGPKGYTRSDERIKEDVNDKLSDDPNVDASEIEVTVNSCEVTLTGTVNSRWEKRHAEDIVESVSGVKNVENRLKVNSNYNTGTTNNDITSPRYGTTEKNR